MSLISDVLDYFIIKKSGKFDYKYYIFTYEDVRKKDVDPLWHFVRYGWKENRNPNRQFNVKEYKQLNPELKTNPFIHYLKSKKNKKKEKKCNTKLNSNYVVDLNKFPLVSIIILTRNGLNYMRTLLNAIKENTLYPNYEIIIVDNASEDKTLEFLKNMQKIMPIIIIENSYNESFSKANNDAAKKAKGELLLFLNNDTEPLKGWLCELVREYLNNPNLGSAGSKLVYPYKEGFKNSCKIQHVGIGFRYEGDFYRPINLGIGDDVDTHKENKNRVALTAACLLVPKKVFEEVEGFDEKYIYGYEDVDLGLKIFTKGYDNVYVANSVLYHYEFGTQSKDSNKEVSQRRLNNMKYFKKKWNTYIKKHYWKDKLDANDLFTTPLNVGIVVSNKGENVAEGDYFTALELGSEFEKFGWNVTYISLKHKEWYNFSEDIDVLVVLLDKYDLRKIPKTQKKIFTIAWPRNWFDRWVNNPSFEMYDLILASGKSACEYIETNSNQKPVLFPIATNPKRFQVERKDGFECDYCFTGSYWNDKRDIIDFLEPSKLPYKFHIYGKNWEKIEKFKPYYKGFVKYSDIPYVYKGTKIVIDDANRVTKPYGSVNSRVFDALGAGVLVITNGKKGSKELFDSKLPYYNDGESLHKLIEFYIKNPEERKKKVKELQEIVLEKHTYEKRAQELKEILANKFLKKSVVIKIPVPKWDVVREWGDYYFAKSLKKEFERLDYNVLIQVLNEWDNGEDEFFDNVLVLRGLSKCNLKDHHFNIMWNISHPDKITLDEYESYDFIYISSILWANVIKSKSKNKNIASLLQCTDSEVFKATNQVEDIDILFVGNSRKVYRKIIKDLLPIKYDVWIFGTNWEQFIDRKYIKGQNIPNEELYKYYNRAKIVLNDHWEDMREKGFISNRVFDVSACGKFLISDKVEGLEDVFGDSIVTYDGSREDLHNKIEEFIANKVKREQYAKNAMEIVRNFHTFKNRVSQINAMLNERVYWWI